MLTESGAVKHNMAVKFTSNHKTREWWYNEEAYQPGLCRDVEKKSHNTTVERILSVRDSYGSVGNGFLCECVCVATEEPAAERKPSFLIPSGASSSKTVLRGQVLEMECIAEGL